MENALKKANKLLKTNYKSWVEVSMHKYLTENFISKFKSELTWTYVCKYQKLSESFIRKYKNKVEWTYISVYQKLSENFIHEFKDEVNWFSISEYQKLSESFIRKFENKVKWDYISVYQKLSEAFIREFKDKVEWDYISEYQKLSESFMQEFKNEIHWRYIPCSWLYKDTEFKKQAVIDTGLYECHDDYFIAYKGIRSDRYSKFNFQYKYEIGGIYESWCDCTLHENSFGLSAWTEEKAYTYSNELVVKVKIRYEDVGQIVHDGGKIRCFKLEVLS